MLRDQDATRRMPSLFVFMEQTFSKANTWPTQWQIFPIYGNRLFHMLQEVTLNRKQTISHASKGNFESVNFSLDCQENRSEQNDHVTLERCTTKWRTVVKHNIPTLTNTTYPHWHWQTQRAYTDPDKYNVPTLTLTNINVPTLTLTNTDSSETTTWSCESHKQSTTTDLTTKASPWRQNVTTSINGWIKKWSHTQIPPRNIAGEHRRRRRRRRRQQRQ